MPRNHSLRFFFLTGLTALTGLWLAMFALASASLAQDTAASPGGTKVSGDLYSEEIQPLFDNRCIACHGCIGSPCNVKLTSFRGLERGGFGKNPYSMHFDDYPRTGMEVMSTTQEWRDVGFYPVVSRGGSSEENLAGSMVSQLVEAGHAFNQPGFSRQALMPSYAKRYKNLCPSTPEALKTHLASNPAEGMPYGLPALEEEQIAQIEKWIAEGSQGPRPETLEKARVLTDPVNIARWEAFFNAPDERSQLVSRYIFDHVYLSTLAFDENPGEVFQLVRSKTAGNSVEEAKAGQANPPVEVIDAPHPYDNPMTYAGVDRFYYRLKKMTVRPVQKNHFIWQLNQSDIAHLQDLFLSPKWEKDEGFDAPWDVGNPFVMYQAIPTRSRYLFLIENSAVVVGGITSGPVCLGQAATYAVKDQFWVYFVDPDYDVSVLEPQLGLGNWAALMDRSPEANAVYNKAYGKTIRKFFPEGYPIDAIWNGDGENKNAWLTVLRHESNTWVMTGRQGGIPRSQWLMGFSGFERIYYDTVAHFEYWGSDVGKLETVAFFNLLRQEFEDHFLLMLPPESREKIRKEWTQGIGQLGLRFTSLEEGDLPSPIQNSNPKEPLLGIVKNIEDHMGPEITGPVDLYNPWVKTPFPLEKGIFSYDEWVKAISTMTVTTDYKVPRYMPSLIMIKLNHGDESRMYSLVVNRVYKSQYTILFQNGQALPDLYTLSVYPDVVGGFPNLFMEFDLSEAAEFIEGLRKVESLPEFLKFRDRYTALRNREDFWQTYDWFNAWNFKNRKQDAGVFDLSYYDLFDSVY